MTAANKVSAAREPIGIAEKRQQQTSRYASIDLTCLFLERIYILDITGARYARAI